MRVQISIALFFAVLCQMTKAYSAERNWENAEILLELQKFDLFYGSSISASGTVLDPAVPGFSIPDRHWRWRYSATAEEKCIVREAIEVPKIPFVPNKFFAVGKRPETTSMTENFDYDQEGNMKVNVEMQQSITFSKERWTIKHRSCRFIVSPDGEMTEMQNDDDYIVRHFRPDDSLELTLRSMMWVMGRGYSHCIQRIDKIEKAAGDLITVSASGGAWSRDENLGTWTLVVDTSKQFLVTSATFIVTEQTRPYFTISTEGIVLGQGTYFPKKGSFQIFESRPSLYTILEGKLQSDITMIGEALAFTNSVQAGSIVMDHRETPASVQWIGPTTEIPIKVKSRSVLFLKISLFFFVVLAVLIVVKKVTQHKVNNSDALR